MPDELDNPSHRGMCLACGYQLRGLPAGPCPECGRPFDPSDKSSMNFGRRPGRVAQLFLRPGGWLPTMLLLIAAALVFSATRWPRGAVVPQAIDLRYYFRSLHLLPRLLTWTDWAYTGGLILAAAAILTWLIRTPLRLILRRFYRNEPPAPLNLGRRFALATIAILATGGSIVIGWPYRIARAWIRQVLAMPPPTSQPIWPWPTLPPPPLILDDKQTLAVLKAAVMQLPTPKERIAALKLLFEEYKDLSLPILIEAAGRESDAHVRATEIHLIGLHQDPSALQPLLSFWNDSDSEVRAAVADAIGMIRAPAYPLRFDSSAEASLAHLATDPHIKVPSGPLARDNAYPMFDGIGLEMNELRPQVVKRLTDGATSQEREAAARALLKWQDQYRLRVAEWGVWFAVNGELKLLQSFIDEIPQFVHRTGDAVSTFDERVDIEIAVLKPILHITANQLMVLDVQMMINSGRPWFAFPKPDDFALDVDTSPYRRKVRVSAPLKQFDSSQIAPLDHPREGYPWLDPAHRHYAMNPYWNTIEIGSLGLRWQSVIVSPEQLSWMEPPTILSDEKFVWWNRLRQVPCSWVSSRGDSERFLYYDGPTSAPVPCDVRLEGMR